MVTINKATCFNFPVLDQKKSNKRGWEKKTFEKKNMNPIFGKVNEGDEIKKTLDIFLEKLLRATKKLMSATKKTKQT